MAEAGFNSGAMFWYEVSCVNALGVPRDLQIARYQPPVIASVVGIIAAVAGICMLVL